MAHKRDYKEETDLGELGAALLARQDRDSLNDLFTEFLGGAPGASCQVTTEPPVRYGAGWFSVITVTSIDEETGKTRWTKKVSLLLAAVD